MLSQFGIILLFILAAFAFIGNRAVRGAAT